MDPKPDLIEKHELSASQHEMARRLATALWELRGKPEHHNVSRWIRDFLPLTRNITKRSQFKKWARALTWISKGVGNASYWKSRLENPAEVVKNQAKILDAYDSYLLSEDCAAKPKEIIPLPRTCPHHLARLTSPQCPTCLKAAGLEPFDVAGGIKLYEKLYPRQIATKK